MTSDLEILTPKLCGFVMECLHEYCRVVSGDDGGRRQIDMIDLDHSALFYHLCTGGKVLKKPPPKFYSRPFHKLYEPGYVYQNCELFEVAFEPGAERRPVVCQCGDFTWKDREAGIILHKNGDEFIYDWKEKTLKLSKENP